MKTYEITLVQVYEANTKNEAYQKFCEAMADCSFDRDFIEIKEVTNEKI